VLCDFLGATLIAFLKNPETLDLINYIQHTCIASKPRSQNEDHQNNKRVEGHHPPPPNDSPWFVGFLSLILCTHTKQQKKKTLNQSGIQNPNFNSFNHTKYIHELI
jgi:hypothetical protein